MALVKNPILRGFNPDPSIVRVGNDYYIATSTFEWFPGVQIHHSENLIDWRLITRPLSQLRYLDMRGECNSGGIWAPCLSYCEGVFYLVYTDVKNTDWPFNETHNYLSTAKNIYGPWSEPVYLNSSGFDPSIFHDDDKKWLLNMELDHRKNRPSMAGILMQEFDAKTMRLIGPVHRIYTGIDFSAEGPHLYKKGGYYYLIVAEGGTWFEHRVMVMRSLNITGEYENYHGNPVLTSKGSPKKHLQRAGHASICDTPNGKWYMVYLCGRPLKKNNQCILGRETAIDEIEWSDDGWFSLSNGSSFPSTEIYINGQEKPKRKTLIRDDFDDPELDINFQTLRTPLGQDYLSLTERKGFLRLKGGPYLNSNYQQSLIARRQQSFCFAAKTCVDFNPRSYKHMAGLVYMYDNQNFLYLRISHCNERKSRVLGIMVRKKGTFDEYAQYETTIKNDGMIFLKITVKHEVCMFHYSENGIEWSAIGNAFDVGFLTDEHCQGFTGTFVGICCQDTESQRQHADFDFFEYEEIEEVEKSES